MMIIIDDLHNYFNFDNYHDGWLIDWLVDWWQDYDNKICHDAKSQRAI